MHLAAVPIAIALAAAPPGAAATEGSAPPALKLQPKAAITASPMPGTQAPFLAPAREPEIDFSPRHDPRADSHHWSCEGERSLCYDPDSQRIIYKPARAFMPDIPGLQRENISVKRDRVVLRYSF